MTRISTLAADSTAAVVEPIIDNSAYDVVKSVSEKLEDISKISASIDEILPDTPTTLKAKIALNTAKETNVTTDITITQTAQTEVVVNSSDGTDGTIVEATPSVSSVGGTAGIISAIDKEKLDGIESGATADQTKSDIDALGVDAATVNNLTVETAVPVSAVFTDTTYSPATGGTNGTDGVDGLLTDLDKFKLDGIETAATADQTASEIATLYEGIADTNKYTDGEKTKLAAIEVGATADQIASEVPVVPAGSINSSDVQSALQEIDARTSVNQAAIASLARSQGSFKSNGGVVYPIAIGLTPLLMEFDLNLQSNDTDIFEIDAVTNTVIFKQARRYTFMSSVTIQDDTGNGNLANIQFRLVNNGDSSVYHTQSAPIAVGNDDTLVVPFNTEIEVATAPLVLRFEVVSDIVGYDLVSFDTVLASQGGDLDSSVIGYDNTVSGLTADIVQDAIDEVDGRLDTAEGKLTTIETNAKDDQVASEVASTAVGNLVATNVQAALQELQGDVDSINTNLTTIFNRDLGGLV